MHVYLGKCELFAYKRSHCVNYRVKLILFEIKFIKKLIKFQKSFIQFRYKMEESIRR